jgi:polar amino acid transport system ATP-binding protein
VIQISNLTKRIGAVTILKGINLTVRNGEMTAIVGPSGSGKSMLLRCTNGLTTFDSGSIHAFGCAIGPGQNRAKSLQILRSKVGMVFQQFHLFPHMTALENVMSGPLLALNMNREQARAIAIRLLDRVGLKERMDAWPVNLSGGQQQRVAIARTLAVNPSAILFDEPTSSLDEAMAGEVLAMILDLAKDGQTMIVVTHDMDLAQRAAVVYRMNAGEIGPLG